MSKPAKRTGDLRAFARYYRPHLPIFILDMVCALGICAIDLIFPIASRYAMQTLLPANLFRAFFVLMSVLFAAYLLRAGFQYIVTLWGHLLGARIEADIRSDLFSHLQNLSFSFYDKNRTGQLMSRMTGDLFEITELAHHGPEDLFISLVTLLGAFFMMLTIRWELTLIVFAVIPFFLGFTIFQRRRMSRASVAVKARLGDINGELESALSGMKTAKAFGNEHREIEKFEHSNRNFRTSKRDYYAAMAVYHSGMELCMGLLPILVIGAGGVFILKGTMDYIDLLTFTLFVSTFITPIRRLTAFVEQFLQGMAGFRRFRELMAVHPAIKDKENAKTLSSVRGDIAIENVTFGYSAEKQPVLSHVSFSIQAGETIAVVGPSGGGKSTLCQLIPRFYEVTEGSISIDGTDIRDVTQQSLRHHIGVVQQDVFLFAGTVYDNILYGKPTASEDEIILAAKKAEIYDDIMDMPNGFHTYVGERGAMLSGGQKQRISIARIFLKNPSILILDEATSALDSVTEVKIQAALDALAQGRTTLIIAHRLSTIRSANRIIVMDDAKIIEQGTHKDLLALDGAYASLYKAQNLG